MQPTLKDLWPGQSVPLLKALHILTHNGGLNADSRRKLKQVQHLAQLIKPAIDAALKEKDQPVLADLGAGKSYLGFILYDLYFGPAGRGRVVGGGSARRADRDREEDRGRKRLRPDGIRRRQDRRGRRWARWISSPRCMPATPPPTKPSCSR